MEKHGILVVNKPKGMTSHDVVDAVRRKLNMRKVGHAGTLDPAATGVLVILLGRCTRLFDTFMNFEKEYVATLTLGVRTSSGDAEGQEIERKDFSHIRPAMIEEAIKKYRGPIMQVPPMVSAVKHKGVPLYKLARKGKDVERTPRKVTISELRILRCDLPEVEFYLRCSRGTYVRQLAEDIANDLDCVGHVSRIERLSVGPFDLKSAVGISEIDESKIRSFLTVSAS